MDEQSNRPQNASFRILPCFPFTGIFHIPTASGPINTFPTCVLPLRDEGKEGKCPCFLFCATSSLYIAISWPWVVQERKCHMFLSANHKEICTKTVQSIDVLLP